MVEDESTHDGNKVPDKESRTTDLASQNTVTHKSATTNRAKKKSIAATKPRTIIHKRRNHLRLRPLRLRIIFFRKPIPPALVRDSDLRKVIVEHGLVEVDDEAFDDVGDLGEGGLLGHLLLDGDEGGFVDPGLCCNIS